MEVARSFPDLAAGGEAPHADLSDRRDRAQLPVARAQSPLRAGRLASRTPARAPTGATTLLVTRNASTPWPPARSPLPPWPSWNWFAAAGTWSRSGSPTYRTSSTRRQDLLTLPLATKTSRITYLGRLEARKGVIELAQAMRLVLTHAPTTKFRLVGRSLPHPATGEDLAAYMRRELGPFARRRRVYRWTSAFRGGARAG